MLAKAIFRISFAFLIFLVACSSEPDLTTIDRLIANGKFSQARKLIEQELQKEWSDTLQYKRLKYRLLKSEKGAVFAAIDSLIKINPNQALQRLAQLEDSLKRMKTEKQKYFYFDLYRKRARIYKEQGQDSLWFQQCYKALRSFTDQYELKQDLFEQCAFYLAAKGKANQGLKMLDGSFREIRLHQLNPQLKKVYYAYMNGEFEKALTLLKNFPVSQKDRHWLNLERFLENYGQMLSKEERFKLW
ncbi:MAG: hypothetical protein J7L94_09040 [Caldisericaceae bacterium]|nr:hypothetical protein [Caldisericaceae bacterium]